MDLRSPDTISVVFTDWSRWQLCGACPIWFLPDLIASGHLFLPKARLSPSVFSSVPIHPQLTKAIMDSIEKPPSLLQRPESADAEVSDFSFTKPASHGRPFSLKNIAKQPTASEAAIDNAVPAADPLEKETFANQCSRADT